MAQSYVATLRGWRGRVMSMIWRPPRSVPASAYSLPPSRTNSMSDPFCASPVRSYWRLATNRIRFPSPSGSTSAARVLVATSPSPCAWAGAPRATRPRASGRAPKRASRDVFMGGPPRVGWDGVTNEAPRSGLLVTPPPPEGRATVSVMRSLLAALVLVLVAPAALACAADDTGAPAASPVSATRDSATPDPPSDAAAAPSSRARGRALPTLRYAGCSPGSTTRGT